VNSLSVGETIGRWVVILLLIFPSVPLVRLWLLKSPGSRVTALERTALLLATGSQAIILLALAWEPLLGGSYSDRRFATILINLFVMLLVAGVVMIRGRSLRWRLAFPCLWLCGSWFFVWAISAAV
jgi:hypothetical protein